MVAKRKRRRRDVESPSAAAKKPSRGSRVRRVNEPFEEWRFEPRRGSDVLRVVWLSLGALAVGAGVYAQFLWSAGPPPGYAWFVLILGAVMLLAYAFFVPAPAGAVHVGDLGVGLDDEAKTPRTAWYEIQQLGLAHDALVLKTAGKPVVVSLASHPGAAQRILKEADRRIGSRVDLTDEDRRRVRDRGGGAKGTRGQRVTAVPPQVTELSCLASGEPLMVERDVRLCARCAAVYHKSAVPKRCAACDASLKG
jgi:hypothetical protein